MGHSVHVEAAGLRPDRWYWFRFKSGDATSPVGRTRTLPTPDTLPKQLDFAFASMGLPAPSGALPLGELLARGTAWRVLADLLLLGLQRLATPWAKASGVRAVAT